jgi:serpin B
VMHEVFIAVDEKGTEAAAATAVVMSTESAGPAPGVLVLDRPFLFVIHDTEFGTPLFIGRVGDPS